MGRWTALVILTVLYRHISSEHITDTNHNDRPTRQLDFEDSCSCEDLDKSHTRRDARYDDALDAGSEDVFLGSRYLDDCPCRFRDSDSEGASSLLFPSTMRSAGNFLRPADKKQEPKPIFNPEVDLASSVLETLRIATDEEYENALARDAAKSAARAMEDDMFGDAVPEESANLFTIVVNPKAADNDDIKPQASHIKQSRCIHPLEGAANPSLAINNRRFSKIRPSILNRNFYDMDSDVAASSINEHITPLDEERRESSTNPLTLTSNTDFRSAALSNDVNDNDKLPLKSLPLQNKLRKIDLGSSPLLRSIRDKTMSSLSHLPKLKTRQSLLTERSNDNKYDLDPAPSTVQEQVVKRIPYYRTNSKYENLKQNNRPLSLPNLLNLKDVELIPLKDLFSKQATKTKLNKPETVLPSLFEYDDDAYSLENQGENTEVWLTTPLTLINDAAEDNTADPDSSPSLVNLQAFSKDTRTADDNYHNEKFDEEKNSRETDTRSFSIENLKSSVENVLPELTNLDVIDCAEEKDAQDSVTDVSNNSDRIGYTDARSIENLNVQSGYSNVQETEDINELKKTPNNPQLKLLDPISIDKTISSIKNYISKKQEDLKNINTNLKNKKTIKQENTDILINKSDNQDCENEESIEVTTIKSHKSEAVLASEDANFSIENEIKDAQTCITSPITLIKNTVDDSISDSELSPSSLNLQEIAKNTPISDNTDNSDKLISPTNSNEVENGPFSAERDVTMENLLPEIGLSNGVGFVEDKNKDQDSITDATNDSDNKIDQPEARKLENENIQRAFSNAQNIVDNNESNDVHKHSKPQLLDPISIDKTITSIKNYILKKQEDLKNLKTTMKNKNTFNQQNKDTLINRDENQDCENEASMQITTLKPNILENNLEVFTTTIANLPDNLEDVTPFKSYVPGAAIDNASECADVTLQDLQKMSNNMLQQEEREISKIEYNNPFENVHEPLSSRDPDGLDLENSANTPTEVMLKPVNLDKIQDKSTEISNCNTDLAPPLIDNYADPSDIVINSIPKQNEILNLQSTFNPAINLLKSPLGDISDTLKLPSLDPLPVVDDIKVKMIDLFDKRERGVEDISPSVLKSHSESSDMLNPIMATDASVSNLQWKKLPFSDGINFDILKLRPESSIFPDFLKLDSKDLNLKSIDLKSALEDRRLNIDKYVLKSSPRETKYLDDILNIRPSLQDLRDRFIDPSLKARNNNKQSTLKHFKNAFESKHRKINNNNYETIRNPIKSSQNLLDTISQNTEDINDKLRALHMDFNDRLESVRNDLIDRTNLLSSGSRGTKPNLKSSSNLHNKHKSNKPKHAQATTRQSKKTASRKETPARFNLSPKALDKKKFKMPVAASVPVPRTVQVPELKTTPTNSPPLTLRKASTFIPNTNDKLSKDFLRNLGEKPNNLENSKTLMKNKNNLGKDKTIKISISTTPRPEMYNGHQFRNLVPQRNTGKLETRKRYDDHYGSPSEIKPTEVPVPDYDQDKFRSSYLDNDDKLLSHRLVSSENYPQKASKTALIKPTKVSVHDYDQDKYRSSYLDNDDKPLITLTQSHGLVSSENYPQKASKTALQSWPRATESAFLSKVKEAVKARLANGNPAKSLKISRVPADEVKENLLQSDMARSASENQVIMDTSLKEHVPYKCKMICTKE